MPHEINAYQCDYCNRTFYRKVDAVNHECACKYNPARRSCYTCKLYQKPEYKEVVESPFIGGEPYEITTEKFICTKFNKPIYEKPYFEECETGGYNDDQPIAGTCWWYEENETENGNDSTGSSE